MYCKCIFAPLNLGELKCSFFCAFNQFSFRIVAAMSDCDFSITVFAVVLEVADSGAESGEEHTPPSPNVIDHSFLGKFTGPSNKDFVLGALKFELHCEMRQFQPVWTSIC